LTRDNVTKLDQFISRIFLYV